MRRRAWALCVLGLVTACGGGSDDDGTPLSGDFHAAALEATSVPTNTCRSYWGSAEVGGSSATLTMTRNTNGTVTGPLDDDFDSAVSPDGSFLLLDSSTNEPVLAGSMGTGGDVAVATAIRSGDLPKILAMTRESTGADEGDLDGAYRFVFFTLQAEGRSSSGTAQFDGSGSGVLDAGAVANVDGVLLSATLGSPNTYTVAADGRVDMDFVFAGTFRGAVDPSREILVLAGAIASGSPPGLLLLVKGAAAASDATFVGNYAMVGLSYDYAAPAVRSFGGGLVADGAGHATAQGTTNTEGTIAATLPVDHTYTVATDGALSLQTPEGTFVGGVAPSGNFALVGGPDTDGAHPAVYLLVRR